MPLLAWLKFDDRWTKESAQNSWEAGLVKYIQFLTEVGGLAAITCLGYVSVAHAVMEWQFEKKPVRWSRVQPADLWRYGEWCAGAKRHQPSYVNRQLSALRQ